MKKISLLLCTLSFLGACSTTPKEQAQQKKEDQRQDFAQQIREEVQVGRTMASKLLGVFGAYKNKKATRYVNLVGQSLVATVGRPELTYHFAILNTDVINAYSTPGGYVFITKGLLDMIHTESELGVVLAHEIDHINSKHMYKDIMPKREVSASEKLTRMMSRGASDISGSLSQAVKAGMKMLLEEGISKEKEYEADRDGMLYAATLGYDPNALARLLKRIERQKNTVKISKTHPAFGPRLEALSRSIASEGLTEGTHTNTKVMRRRFAFYIGKHHHRSRH